METLYVDVYFLVNFTVNLLAAHFAAKMTRITSSLVRLSGIAAIGGVLATLLVLFFDRFLPSALLSVAFLIVSGFLVSGTVRFFRRLRFLLLFVISEMVIGGIVFSAYSLLDQYVGEKISEVGGEENRRALIFALLILLSIGVFKFMMLLFSSLESEKSVLVKITVGDKSISAEALVDSGNLVKDPMNMSPVLFIKPAFARKILPENVISLSEIDSLERAYRKRIRLIPVTRAGSTHVMTGVRADSVCICTDGIERSVDLTLAIDKEEGTFGGYELLLPSAVIDDVV